MGGPEKFSRFACEFTKTQIISEGGTAIFTNLPKIDFMPPPWKNPVSAPWQVPQVLLIQCLSKRVHIGTSIRGTQE